MKAYNKKIIKQNKGFFSLNFLLSEKFVPDSNIPFIKWQSDNFIICSANNAKHYNIYPFFKNTSTIIP